MLSLTDSKMLMCNTVLISNYLRYDYKPKSSHLIWKSQVQDFTDIELISLQF